MGFEVRVHEVSKRYEAGDRTVVALDDVSFGVPAGAAVAVSGPSGSGKSTLLHMVGAMDRLDAGTVVVNGQDLSRLGRSGEAAYRRRIGFVFQRFHLIPALSSIDNVLAPLVPFKTEFDRVERARSLLEAVGLAGREEFPPARLSGGEQQRVAIARALINDPGLLLADEPTGNLDSDTTEEIMGLLMDIRAKRQMTLIVATHDPLVATRCERILSLQDGAITGDIRLDTSRAEDSMNRILGLDRLE